MVAIAPTAERLFNTAPRVRAQNHKCRLSAMLRLKSNGQASLRGATYDKSFRLESCSKDPIGYVDGENLFLAYFILNDTDPSGMVRNSACQSKDYQEDCRACCKDVPGAGGRRGCENSCNRKPKRRPPTPTPESLCSGVSASPGCAGCSATCEEDVQDLIDRANEHWVVDFPSNCQAWVYKFPRPRSPCFKMTGTWISYPLTGIPGTDYRLRHVFITVTMCDGTTFLIDNGWWGPVTWGPGNVFPISPGGNFPI